MGDTAGNISPRKLPRARSRVEYWVEWVGLVGDGRRGSTLAALAALVAGRRLLGFDYYSSSSCIDKRLKAIEAGR